MADARCAQCGGNVAVRLTGPPLSCSYCGSDKPLAPDVAARVETLRVDLERHKGRSQQLLGKQVFAGVVSSSWVLTLLVILWGGVITGAATCEPLPKGHTTFATLSGPRLRATDPTSRALVTKWWLLYLPLTGFTFNLALWSVMRLRGRRVIRAALPRAPRAAGAPLRCRCCAADLPEGGAIRRCAFCDADHVVLGSRYQKEQTSLARELDALQSQVGRTLADRDRTATRVAAILMPSSSRISATVLIVP